MAAYRRTERLFSKAMQLDTSFELPEVCLSISWKLFKLVGCERPPPISAPHPGLNPIVAPNENVFFKFWNNSKPPKVSIPRNMIAYEPRCKTGSFHKHYGYDVRHQSGPYLADRKNQTGSSECVILPSARSTLICLPFLLA